MRALQTPPAILLVEDDDAIREACSEVLELQGYRVVTARNGQEALQQLPRRERWGLILLDMMMPRMDGQQFLDHLAARVSPVPLPIVVVSAHARACPPHAQALLAKPVDLGELLRVVQRFCAPPRPARAA